MWEDYSDFISNFRDDLEEPYILPDEARFAKMCKAGSLGDYLGLPTFGTHINSTVKLIDYPCATGSRNFSNSTLEDVMAAIRDDLAIPGITCAKSLNNKGTQPVIFKTELSAASIPKSTTQVGIDVTITGGDSALFDGARGYMYYLLDDGTYFFDMPIEFKKSADGIVGFSISSVDASKFGGKIGRAHV